MPFKTVGFDDSMDLQTTQEFVFPFQAGQVFFGRKVPDQGLEDDRRVVLIPQSAINDSLPGVWVISPQGKHLWTIIAPMHPHNMAWGDDDGRALYLCARTGLYRIRLNIPGIRP
jgi:hypothetical protein